MTSERGKGTTVTVKLPAATGQETEVRRQETGAQELGAGVRR